MFRPDRIESLRLRRKVSQQKLIDQSGIGVALQTYRNWIMGRTSPTATDLEKLSYFFGVPVSFFFASRQHKIML